MINLFILNPFNIKKEKYILEYKLQKIFYKNNNKFQIHLIPAKYNKRNFFNKFFSLIEYFKDKKIPDNSFYCDHDIFILNEKYFENFFKRKIFFNYDPPQIYNWKKIFKDLFDIDISSNFYFRFPSAIFPLYNFFLTELEKELQIIFKYNPEKFYLYSGLLEEYFYSKVIKKYNFKVKPIKINNMNNFIYIMHYRIKESFAYDLIKKNKDASIILKKLKNIYQKFL